MNEILQIRNLSAGYNGKTVLQNISFAVNQGEVLAVIGQNGCGKSTLLKTIARIIRDNSGDIIFEGLNLNSKNTWDLKQLGVSCFVQGGMIFPTLKVSEHFGLALKKKGKTDANKIKEECISYFPALASCMDKRGGNLSGGERQMLSFSMLLSQETHCWLLDEPTAGLAPSAIKKAVDFLKEMKQERNKTVILVEHNYQVAFELADSLVIIEEGVIKNKFYESEFQKNDFLQTNFFN
ncbi:MAG: ATP-binding cassette domain-containing protein [Bacteroidia bacterium]|nr:ATP-binding cassette domain-containing protein [Bacteroidia bacterium]